MEERVTVVTASQLERIRAQASTKLTDTQKQAELLRRKELSDARAATWTNTLQASRERKTQEAQERCEREEAARLEADRAEAAERAAARQLAIQRANKMLHDEGDRVKALHGRLLLSEVIAQNRALAEHKGRVTAARRAQDAAFVKRQQEALEVAEQAELDKLAAEKARLLAQRDVQSQQLEELKTRILAERAADKAEGELVRRKAAEEAAELAAKEAAWRAKMEAMNDATAAANMTLQAFRAAEKERERLTDAAIEEYCKRKEATDAEQAAAIAAKQAAKEARRKAQVELMESNYMAWHTKTEAALAADVQQAEDKAAAEAEAQRQRRQRQHDEAHRSNQQQLARKAADAEAAREADRAFRAAWGERLAQLKEEERQEAADARARALAVQRFQEWQAARRSAARAAGRRADVQAALMAEAAVVEAEEGFGEYAAALHAEAARRGLPLEPIDLYLKSKQPSIAASM